MKSAMPQQQLTRSPVDDSVYIKRPLASPAVVDRCVIQAIVAQARWRQRSLDERAAICYAMVEALERRTDEIAEQLCWMMGRPIRFARLEVAGMAERARYMIAAASHALAPLSLPDKPGFRRAIHREPLGLVLILAPWNYPYLTAVNVLVPALMAGNAVLLKPSRQTPLCGEQFQRALDEAGLPAGLFRCLHLDHQGAQQLVGDPRIDYIAFTGSVAGGEAVQQAAASRFVGLGLELGGKDPAYVRHDADIDQAVASCIDGAFFNSGQSCCAIERVYVHQSCYRVFVDKAVALINHYRLGRPDDPATTLGPLVNADAAARVRQQIAEAVAAGARTHIDPANFPADRPGSPYLAPQLLTDVGHKMAVMREESFGPVVGVMPVANDDEAITLMNDSDYGLTAAIYSKDVDQAAAIGEQLVCGTVFVNRCDYLDPALAWTGVRQSGRGVSLSVLGYQALTRPKSFHIKLTES